MAFASGCASTEPPLAETATLRDPRAHALEQAVAAVSAREGGAVAHRTSMTVEAVEEAGENLVFDLRILRSASFGRPERDFVVVSRCPATSPDTCRDNAIAALRAAAKVD